MSSSAHLLERSLKASLSKNALRRSYYKPKRKKRTFTKKKQDQSETELPIELPLLKPPQSYTNSAQRTSSDSHIDSGKKYTAIRHPRRGIFHSSELLQHKEAKAYEREFGCLEAVSLIRFPPSVAQELRRRLLAQWAQIESMDPSTLVPQDISSNNALCGFPQNNLDLPANLGLTITPLQDEDHHIFDLVFEKTWGDPSSAIHLCGILFEMPCLLEVYKSLEDDLLFKCNDVSQLLYVYHKDQDPPFDLATHRTCDLWEWKSGLTAGTHRIRSRKFKNFNVFEKSDVSQAEAHLCNILNSEGITETVTLEASNELVMETELDNLFHSNEAEKKNLVSIIRPDNPIFKAALMRVSPKEAAPHFLHSWKSLAEIFSTPKDTSSSQSPSPEETLAFNTLPNCQLNAEELIPDDLSDYLFGEVEKNFDESEDLDPATYGNVIEELNDDDNYFQTIDENENFDSCKEDFD